MKSELQNYLKELSSQGVSNDVPKKINEQNILKQCPLVIILQVHMKLYKPYKE